MYRLKTAEEESYAKNLDDIGAGPSVKVKVKFIDNRLPLVARVYLVKVGENGSVKALSQKLTDDLGAGPDSLTLKVNGALLTDENAPWKKNASQIARRQSQLQPNSLGAHVDMVRSFSSNIMAEIAELEALERAALEAIGSQDKGALFAIIEAPRTSGLGQDIIQQCRETLRELEAGATGEVLEEDTELRAKLKKMRLADLKKHALEMGCDQRAVVDADDEEDPAEAVIKLSLAKARSKTAPKAATERTYLIEATTKANFKMKIFLDPPIGEEELVEAEIEFYDSELKNITYCVKIGKNMKAADFLNRLAEEIGVPTNSVAVCHEGENLKEDNPPWTSPRPLKGKVFFVASLTPETRLPIPSYAVLSRVVTPPRILPPTGGNYPPRHVAIAGPPRDVAPTGSGHPPGDVGAAAEDVLRPASATTQRNIEFLKTMHQTVDAAFNSDEPGLIQCLIDEIDQSGIGTEHREYLVEIWTSMGSRVEVATIAEDRSALEKMNLGDLKNRAREIIGDEKPLDDADATDDPKRAVIEIILAKTQTKAERRVDPMLDNREVTWQEMRRGLADQQLREEQLLTHWNNLKPAQAAATEVDPKALEGMYLGDLKQTAREKGCDPSAVDGVDWTADPKQAVIDLILAKTLTEVDPNMLEGMRLGDLKNKAREMGYDKEAVDGADDKPDPKQAVIKLIVAKTQTKATTRKVDPMAEFVASPLNLELLPDDQIQWMWGDASLIGHRVAASNPLRWSYAKCASDTILDLGKETGNNLARSVSIVVKRAGKVFKKAAFSNISEATAALSLQATTNRPQDELLAELKKMNLRVLKMKALEVGCAEKQVDDADDADEPREAVINLIMKALEMAGKSTPEPAEATTSRPQDELLAELNTMNLKVLKTKALEVGCAQSQVDDADDAEEPREAVINLIMKALEMAGYSTPEPAEAHVSKDPENDRALRLAAAEQRELAGRRNRTTMSDWRRERANPQAGGNA